MGDVRGLDRLLCRHRDADNNPATSLAGMSDGLEEAVYYVQNHRGDVVALVDAFGNPLERIRYTAYGEPQAYHPVDFQNRGEVTPDTLSDYIAYFFAPDTDAKPPGVDFNCSGALDPDDLSSFIEAFFGPPDPPPLSDPTGPVPPGVGSLSRASVDNRFGYAAYVWDNHLGLYHVRNRVYDPYHGRWLQPDPIGFAGGMNLYQYCGGDPVDRIDPLGLDGWWIARPFYWAGWSSAGEYVNDTVDGSAELGGYYAARPSVSQVLADAQDPEARQDVHDALHTVRDAADKLPGGQLASTAVNIVDKGLGVADALIDGGTSVGPGAGKSVVDATLELAEAGYIGYRSAGKGGAAGKGSTPDDKCGVKSGSDDNSKHDKKKSRKDYDEKVPGQQREEIEERQRRLRKAGYSHKIESIEKSKQRDDQQLNELGRVGERRPITPPPDQE